MLRDLFITLFFVLTGSGLFGNPYGDRGLFEQLSIESIESDEDWILFDTKQQSKRCLETALVNIDTEKLNTLFFPPRFLDSRKRWCHLLGQKLYAGYNQRSVLPALLKELVNHIYSGVTYGSVSNGHAVWLSKHGVCIDAWKTVCFD